MISLSSPNTPFQSSPATSIHPSDSISQSHRPPSTSYVMAPPAQPAIRPPQYPFEILWLLEDCRQDPTVGVMESNKSWPAMDRAIRHPDGRMVCDVEWNAIKTSARLIVHDLASLPQAESNRIAKVRRTKVFYRSQYPRQWRTAIQQLEDQQPLLKLCASNWKADHVLGNALLAAKDPDAPLTKRRKSKDKKKKQAKGKEKEKEKEKEKNESESESEDGEDDGDDKEKDNSMSSKDMSKWLSIASASISGLFIFSGSSSLRIPTLHIPSVSDVMMASPSSSGASRLKRAEPSSSPQKRDPAKKRRGEKSNEQPVSKIDWLSGLNPGANSATKSPPTHKVDDASKLIQIDASCMYPLFKGLQQY
jgi:thiamine pyrophosphokinase